MALEWVMHFLFGCNLVKKLRKKNPFGIQELVI